MCRFPTCWLSKCFGRVWHVKSAFEFGLCTIIIIFISFLCCKHVTLTTEMTYLIYSTLHYLWLHKKMRTWASPLSSTKTISAIMFAMSTWFKVRICISLTMTIKLKNNTDNVFFLILDPPLLHSGDYEGISV